MDKNVTISIASPEDALDMSLIHKKSWTEAYKDLLPSEYLAKFSDSHWVALFERVLPDPSTRAWLLRVDGEPVACAFVSPSRYQGYQGELELQSIYCLPEYRSNGYGRILLEHVISYAEQSMFSTVCAWVLQGNDRAISFYRRMGFVENGSTMDCVIDGREVVELRFIKPISPSLPSVEQYRADPGRMSSLPYHKMKEMWNFICEREMPERNLASQFEESHQRFFKLIHDLKVLDIPILPHAYRFVQVFSEGDIEDEISQVANLLQLCYPHMSISRDSVRSWTMTPYYDPTLWVWVEDQCGERVALGVADFDREVGESILEWIQVLPEHRRMGISTSIIRELLLRSKKAGADFAMVSGDANNPFSVETMYRKVGFFGYDYFLIKQGRVNQ